MRRVALAALGIALMLAGRAYAEAGPGTLENLYGKTAIANEDRQQIRQWVTVAVNTLVTSTDAERRGMMGAREALVAQCRKDSGRSPAFLQAFGEEAVAVLKEGEKKAISQDARVNLFMAVAELRAVEAIPLLVAELEKGPYPASRYWAARGMAIVADTVVEKQATSSEAVIAESISKVFDNETATVMLVQFFDALGRFEHEKAHDVLADGLAKVATRVSASDPIAAQMLDSGVGSLEKAYAREVRPEAKTRILMTYAMLCTWIFPPVADSALMPNLNASLEKIIGDKVGFLPSDDAVMQKLALLEWVEKLVRDKRIPRRPALPPVVEGAVNQLKGAGGAEAKP